MNNINGLNQNLCSHGIQEDKPCLFCAQEGVYFQRDTEVYAEIYIKTSNVSFELAFELDKRIKIWKEASKNLYLGDYFKAIKKSERIRWSENSLRQAYTVALEFPDLSEKRENRLCFSSYREIANAGISLEQKQEIRKIAEDEKLRFEEVRKLIKNEYKNEEMKVTDDSEIKEEIVYHTDEDFVKEIKEFLERHKDLKGGTTIILKYKNRK